MMTLNGGLREISASEIQKLEVMTWSVVHQRMFTTFLGSLAGFGIGLSFDEETCTTISLFGSDVTLDPAICTREVNKYKYLVGAILGAGVGLLAGLTLEDRWKDANESGPTLSPVMDIGFGRYSDATVLLGMRIRF